MLGSCLGLAAAPALAQTYPFVSDVFEISGIHRESDGVLRNMGCMILGNNGNSTTPSLFTWGQTQYPETHCGLSQSSPQAQWEIYPIVANGLIRHVIKSAFNGKCLIRGQNGTARNASVYLWPDNADKQFCGLNSAAEFVSNGQAAWDLTGLDAIATGAYFGTIGLSPAVKLQFSPTLKWPAIPPSDYSLAEFPDSPSSETWMFVLNPVN